MQIQLLGRKPGERNRILTCAAITVIATTCAIAPHSKASVPIYGGLAYDSTTGTGYTDQTVPYSPGQSAGDGAGVGSASKSVSNTGMGTAAAHWDLRSAVELPPLSFDGAGNSFSFATAINSAGTIVGQSELFSGATDLGPRAVKWDATTYAITPLGNLGTDNNNTTSSAAYAINDAGAITGYVELYDTGADLGQRAVRWDAGSNTATPLQDLGTASNNTTSTTGVSINASGSIAGYAQKYQSGTDLGTRAVRWNAGGTAITELGDLGTGAGSFTAGLTYAINDANTTVGYMNKYVSGNDVGIRAVRWDGAGTLATELGNLGTTRVGGQDYTSSQAYAINASGTAAGYASKYDSDGNFLGYRAVRWAADTTDATPLGDLGTDTSGVANSFAFAISDSGITVGYADKYTPDGNYQGPAAVAWGTDGTAIDLNTLLSPSDAADWTLTEADSISNTNWITGIGQYDPDGSGPEDAYQRAFLIQLPEPTSLMVVFPALLALASRRRRVSR